MDRYGWKAILVGGKELYEIENNGQVRLFKELMDLEENNQLNELFLIDVKTGQELFGVNFWDGSCIIVQNKDVIKFKTDGSPYRAIFYRLRFIDVGENKRLLNKGISRYGIGWQYTSKKNVNKKVIIEFSPNDSDWRFVTE